MLWCPGIHKTRWLSHVHLLLKNAMKKGVLDIQLTQAPPTRDCNGENQANSDRFDDGTECIIIVQDISLFEPLGNESCLMTINCSILLVLECENPFAVDHVDIRWWWNQRPGAIVMKGRKLELHGRTPRERMESFTMISRFLRREKRTSRRVIRDRAISVLHGLACVVT